MEVIVCNASRPEDGSVSIHFPIPRQKYDNVIMQLGYLRIGDAVKQDCCVQEIISEYSVLESLEQSCVNLDELNYLAKRLDSFRGYEAVQFEAAASAEGITSIQGFINLTFCCSRVTVVEDFKDFERIGKNHVMARNNGIVSKEEWENCNFQQEALYLLLKEEGIITPYGVVYENGMELKRLYQGKTFPKCQNGENRYGQRTMETASSRETHAQG